MTDNPYAQATLYHAAGWNPLPLPYGKKGPPPPGYTGRDGRDVSRPDIAAWQEGDTPHNIAIRLPANVIGLDVDAYDGRPGAETLADLKARCGQLPPTWRSSSREWPSGIRFYRLPAGVDSDNWPNTAGPGIDIIRRAHRYAVVWPSVHPSGDIYEWDSSEVPNVSELPELPAAWVSHMELLAQRSQSVSAGGLPHDDVFAAERRFTVQQARDYVRPYFEALRSATPGEINNRLNDAAKVLSHFGPEFWSRASAVGQLRAALSATAYDGRTWQAEDTIASAYRSAVNDWRAVLVPGVAVEETAQRTVRLTSAADIQPRRARWLHHNRIAMGTIALLAGREGLGKSTLAIQRASEVTRGELDGEYKGQAKSVLIAATEDGWAQTIVPRLIAADADLSRVYRVDVVSATGFEVELELPIDVDTVAGLAEEVDATLLILDPFISRLGGLDTHKDADVRKALEPLAKMADRAGLAVLGLIHHNKSGGTNPLDLVMASKAFTAVARSVHTVLPDPDDETGQRRLYGTPKNNLGPDNLPTLGYQVIETTLPIDDDGPIVTSRLEWLGESETSVLDALQSQGQDRTVLSEATDWLQDYLTMNGGAVWSADAKRDGKKSMDLSEDALKRARKKIRCDVVSQGMPRRTFWRLPGSTVLPGAGPPLE